LVQAFLNIRFPKLYNMCVLVILMICHICVYGIYFHSLFDTVCLLGLEAVVVVIGGSWIYNYLCNQCLSPLML